MRLSFRVLHWTPPWHLPFKIEIPRGTACYEVGTDKWQVFGECHCKGCSFSGTCHSSARWWVNAQPLQRKTAEPTATSQQSNNFCLLKLFSSCFSPANILWLEEASSTLYWERRREKVTWLCDNLLGGCCWSHYSSCLFSEFSESAVSSFKGNKRSSSPQMNSLKVIYF